MSAALKPGYKRTEVGVIPEDWDVGRVGEAFVVCNHLRLPISQTVRGRMAGDYPYYGPTGVQGWIDEYRAEGEYALIGEDGDHFLKWRSQPMTLLVRGRFNVNNHAHLVRGIKNLTQWFYWFFAHRDITPHLTRQGAGRFKLTKTAVLQLPCALPSLPEQRAIAAALSDVDALIGALDQLIAKKRDIKQAAMQQLLTGQTRLPRFASVRRFQQTESGGIPADWRSVRLDELGTWKGGMTPSMKNPSYWEDGSIPWASSGDIKSPILNDTALKITEMAVAQGTTTVLPPNSIVLVTRSGILRRYLPVAVTPRAVAINQDIKGLIPHANVVPTYLSNLLTAHGPRILAECLKSGTTVESIEPRWLKAYTVPLPNPVEQSAIAGVLSDMDAEIAALEARRDKTRALKQGMMQELLTGRVRLV